MLRFSQQWKIVYDTVLSYKNKKITYGKISEKIMLRDKMFLNPKKYEIFTTDDFKFIVFYTGITNNTKIELLKRLNCYTDEDIKNIQKIKNLLIQKERTLEKDIEKINCYIKEPKVIHEMYLRNEISILGYYNFFKNNKSTSRIQQKTFQNIECFFNLIKDYN